MRIAIISTMSGAAWGGAQELWRVMAETAMEEHHEVVLSFYRWPAIPSKLSHLQKRGLRVLWRPQLGRNWWRQGVYNKAGMLLSPFRSLFALKPDVICVSQGGTYDAVILKDLAGLLCGSSIPYVIISQCNTDSYVLTSENRRSAIKLFNQAFSVVFVSDETRTQTERQLATRVPNAVFINNPVNLSDCRPVPWPSSELARMASVASLDINRKAQDILFEVLGNRVWQQRNWRLGLYGDGLDKQYLVELAAFYGISDRVDFKGHVSDVRSIWADNHILVLPSRMESGPLALVEAMICGRPTVATDVGGIVEWLKEPATGFVAEAPTVRSFGAAMERAWAARKDWAKIGERAHVSADAKRDAAPGKRLLEILVKAARSRNSELPAS